MTQRLYYENSYCTEFDAAIVRNAHGAKDETGVVLDRTCFYPTSGGQPCDHGTLNDHPVYDVTEEGNEIIHWVQGPIDGPVVHGQVNWARRFDHMQQHTGQHILSEAFLKTLGAETVSFHLGEDSSTIDLDRANLDAAQAAMVEDLANQVVFANHTVCARMVEAEELASLELRKSPAVEHDIRIVEVQGFDRSPCGGTHCARAGEVGPIAILRWERRGQETRVEFVCGWRAIRDYRWKTSALNELALAFSVKDSEVAEAIGRLSAAAADDRRQLNRLKQEMLVLEAERRLEQAKQWGSVRMVVQSFVGRDPQDVRSLALLLTKSDRCVALLGAGGEHARLFFARSPDVAADMAVLLKSTCQAFGGSGGGQPHLAQGGGLPGDRVDEALHFAEQGLRNKG